MTITWNGKRINLTKLTYIEVLAIRNRLSETLRVVDARLNELALQARREFGVVLPHLAEAQAAAAPPPLRREAPPAVTTKATRRKRGPMSEEQKARLREAQRRIWAQRRQQAGQQPEVFTTPPAPPVEQHPAAPQSGDTPRLVPPGTHL